MDVNSTTVRRRKRVWSEQSLRSKASSNKLTNPVTTHNTTLYSALFTLELVARPQPLPALRRTQVELFQVKSADIDGVARTRRNRKHPIAPALKPASRDREAASGGAQRHKMAAKPRFHPSQNCAIQGHPHPAAKARVLAHWQQPDPTLRPKVTDLGAQRVAGAPKPVFSRKP